jgi:hypothetical protein
MQNHLMIMREQIYKNHFGFDLKYPIEEFVNCFMEFYHDQLIGESYYTQTDENDYEQRLVSNIDEAEIN